MRSWLTLCGAAIGVLLALIVIVPGCRPDSTDCSRAPDTRRNIVVQVATPVTVKDVGIFADSVEEYCKLMLPTADFDRMLDVLDPTSVIADRKGAYNLYLYAANSVTSTPVIDRASVMGFTIYYLDFDDRTLYVRTYVRDSNGYALTPIPELEGDVDGLITNCTSLIMHEVLPIHGLSARTMVNIYHTEAVQRVQEDLDRYDHFKYGAGRTFMKNIERYIAQHGRAASTL